MADSPDQSDGAARSTGPGPSPSPSHAADAGPRPGWRTAGRLLLGGFLILAGASHLGWSREAFYAQVPPWLPLDRDFIVVASGLVEIALGTALLLLRRRRTALGWIVAAFFVAIFPGNISQFATGTDSFGLNSDQSRGIRLLFQPVLVVWALWCTGAWRAWRKGRHARRTGS
jgi:uncharacterized membrane protein